MKPLRIQLIAVLAMMAGLLQAQTNVLRVGQVTAPAGKTAIIPIEMDNASDIMGVQFDIDVPYDLSADDGSPVVNLSQTRCTTHQTEVYQTSTSHWRDPSTHGGVSYYKTYRFIIYSSENTRIVGSTGTLLTLEMPLPEDLANGTVFPIHLIEKSVVLSNRDKQNLATGQEDGKVTVETVPRPDLLPTAVSVKQTLAAPGDELEFNYTVKNQGDKATGAGWTERLYLENQTTHNRVHIGTQAYEGTLAVGAEIQRTAKFQLSELPGISGQCRPVVQIVPSAGCGEISLNQDNNTLAAKNYTLRINKYLLLTANKSLIPKNSGGGYWCELRRTGDASIAETFSITSSDKAGKTDRLRFSDNGQVRFTVGASRTGFYVYPVNNDRFDISQEVAVIVNAALNNGYDLVADTVRIEETNQVPITLTTDKTDYEEGDVIHLTASVPVRPWPGQLAVYLTIEEQKRFKLPQRVVFEEGALTATIDIPVLQDKLPANDVSVKISGTADHHQKGETLIMLHDDDVPAITMKLTPATVSEGAGPQAVMGTITRSEVTNNKITIKLSDDGANDIYYSMQTITMPAGTTTVNFPLGLRDNQQVDGDRLVHIRAAVYMTDCNCSAIGDRQAVVVDSITIADDDGPTLALTTDRATILEGDAEGCTLTITRNTTAAPALDVTLTSDATDVEFSSTVTIPAGQQSVTTTFAAKSNSTEEGDRTVSITAKATGYSAGSTWLLISDRTLPDATFASFSLGASSVNMGDSVQVMMQVQNIGAATLPAGTIVALYREGSAYNGTLWTNYSLPEAVEKGQTKTFTFTPTPIDRSGTFTVWAKIDPENRLSELLKVNNASEKLMLAVTSLFNYTATTDKAYYNVGDEVNFSGTCVGINGTTVRNSIDVFVELDGQRTVLSTKNGTEGAFSAIYKVPAGYKGTLRYGACNYGEGNGSQNYLGSFEVLGMERASTDYVTNELYKGEPKTGTIRLRNVTSKALTNITATFTGATDNYDINVEPLATLPANGEADITYTITGRNVSTSGTWEQIQFVLTAAEGTTLSVNTWNYTKQRYATLDVAESFIKTNILRNKSITYPLVITNNGENETGKINISLPSGIGKLITLASPAELPSMQQGDSTTILLRFNGEGLDLNVEQTGTFSISCEKGSGVCVRFALTPVSSSVGNLRVMVQDEFTIYGDKDGNKPYVSEATVALKDYNTGADIATATTGESGVVVFNNISEGYYQLYVTAPKHDSYRQNVYVSPGETKTHTATISYQAVSVSWDVVETTVEDEYEIVSTLTYETQVPVPVIVMTMPDSLAIDRIDYGKATMFNIVLRNEGLITAQETTLSIPEVEGYTFSPLVEYEGVNIGAQQSYVIPVRITRNEEPAAVRGVFRASGSTPCSGNFDAGYWWPCGNDHKHAWVGHTVSLLADHDCVGGSLGGYGGGGDFGGPAFGGGGGVRPTWNEYRVNQGIIDMICAGLNLVPTPPDWFVNGVEKGNKLREIWSSNDNKTKKLKDTWDALKPKSAADQLKDKINDVTAPVRDWYNFAKGVKNAYNSYGPGKKSRTMRAPEDGEQTDSLAVYEEGSAEWYEQQFAQYYENGNDHLYNYMNKMYPYSVYVNTIFDMQMEILGAEEAVLEMTDDFSASIDAYNDEIVMLDSYGQDYFGDVANITGRQLSGAYMWKVYDWQQKLEGLRLNNSPTYYDFYYQKYLKRWYYTYYNESNDYSLQNYNRLKDANIIHMYKIKEYSNRLDSCENAMVLMGFGSWEDLYMSAQQDILDFYEDQGSNTCATVKLEIDQKLVMTRQAFRGTLTVENSLDQDLTGIELSVLVKNLLNEEATSHEFQINFESIDGFEPRNGHGGDTDIEGPWTLGPKAKGTATILFIPTKYAAPEQETIWSFGGTLYFTDGDGVTQVRELTPVSLTVKPSPELDLTYFVQRDIYGDNPLTKDVIEPVIPAEFSVLIHNKGKGLAQNIRMFTKQPRIVENEKGLLVDFAIVSSRLNGGETVLALDSTIATQFGDIPAGGSSYAEWGLTSTLLGHFVNYDISVNHLTSYGNPDLSLLDEVTIHELIHSATATVPNASASGTTTLRAWAVNDGLGINPDEQPDRLYLSDGTYKPILSAVECTTMKYINGFSGFKYHIVIDDQAVIIKNRQVYDEAGGDVWIYTSIPDPTMGGGGIVSLRQYAMQNNAQPWYGNEVPADNYWQTQYTMRDGADPLRDNKVHLLLPFPKRWIGQDKAEFEIEFEPTPQNRLDVKSIESVPQGSDIATEVLDELTVTFNKPILAETFTSDDLVLRYEGEKQTSDITIKKAETSDSIFTLKMKNVDRNGYYTLQVHTANVTDQENFPGLNGKQVGWMLYKGGLIQYNVEPWPSSKVGSVTTDNGGATSGDAQYGTEMTMTATPATGYDFSYWGTVDPDVETPAQARARRSGQLQSAASTLQESQISFYSDNDTIVVPMNQAYNLRAVFKPKKFTVNVVYDKQIGSVKVGNDETATAAIYDYGTVLQFVAQPLSDDYIFEGYYDGDQLLSSEATFGYNVGADDASPVVTITARFRLAVENVLLREAVDYTPADMAQAYVRLQQTFTKDEWNTIVLPCAVEKPEQVFGAGTRVAQLKGIAQLTPLASAPYVLQFETVESMQANVPYIILVGSLNNNGLVAKRSNHQSIYNVGETSISKGSPVATLQGVTMTGAYADAPIAVDNQNSLLKANTLNAVETAAQTGRFKAWFSLPASAVTLSPASKPLPLLVTVDGIYLTDLRGDVNTDGLVNAEDVASVTEGIANGQSSMVNVPDMNRDGKVDIADLLAILRIMAR